MLSERKTFEYNGAKSAYHIFEEISRIISPGGENFVASMIAAGLLQYFPCLLGPQHEIQVAHGDVNGFGEFFHLCFCGQVLSFGQGVGNPVYYPESLQILEYVPVENG